MGNSPKKINESQQYLWMKDNRNEIKLSGISGGCKIFSCDCKTNKKKPNELIVASCDSTSYITIWRVSINVTKNNKIKAKQKRIKTIHDDLNGHGTITVSISSNLKYIASGSTAKTIFIYKIEDKNEWNKRYREFTWLNGCVWYVMFAKHDDNMLLSCNNDEIVLYDIEKSNALLTFSNYCNEGIMCLDHLYLNNKHLIAFCSIDSNVYIDDITNKLNKNSNDTHDGLIKLGNFNDKDVNFVKFSPNGQFIAATSDDGTYEIYYNYKDNKQWEMIHKRIFEEKTGNEEKENKDEDSFGTCLVWTDNNSLMVGCSQNNVIYATNIVDIKSNQHIDAIIDGIESILQLDANNDFEWIINLIFLFLPKWYIEDYKIDSIGMKDKNINRISCLSSCQIERKNDDKINILVVGDWCGQLIIIIPHHN